MAGLAALSLAVAPVCWTHYQLLQYPGAAMLLTAAIRRRDWRPAFATAAWFALVYQLPQRFLIAYHDAHNSWTTASPFTLYLWSTAPPLASLALFALTLRQVAARSEDESEDPCTIFELRSSSVREMTK